MNSKLKKTFIAMLAAAATLGAVVPAFAQDSTALLVASRGEVYAELEADRRAPVSYTHLRAHET